MMYRLSTLTASAALAFGLSVASQADSFDETLVQAEPEAANSVAVHFDAAELQTEEGRDSIQRRIRFAAEEVCGPQNMRDAGSLSILKHNKACYDKAIASAHAQIGESQVATR